MSDNVESKKLKPIKSIKGWFVPQMRQLLDYTFKTCFIDIEIKQGRDVSFLCLVAEHTDKEIIEDFSANFLKKNKIDMHFNYVIDPVREPKTD